MKILLVLSVLLCVAAAAPTEEATKKTLEAPTEASGNEEPAAPEVAEQKPVADPEPEEEKAEEAVKEGDMMMEKQSEEMINEPAPAPRHAPVFEDPEEKADVEIPQAPESRFVFCPDGWFRQGSRCFLFVNSPMSWYSAEEHCNNLGTSLASVSNPKEYRFLQQLTQTAGQSTAWLGGFNLQNRWMWIDRAGFYYTNWYSQASVSSYPCLLLNVNNGWRNLNCATSLRFICAMTPGSC